MRYVSLRTAMNPELPFTFPWPWSSSPRAHSFMALSCSQVFSHSCLRFSSKFLSSLSLQEKWLSYRFLKISFGSIKCHTDSRHPPYFTCLIKLLAQVLIPTLTSLSCLLAPCSKSLLVTSSGLCISKRLPALKYSFFSHFFCKLNCLCLWR